MMTNGTDAIESTKPNKTGETTRETHLDRAEELLAWWERTFGVGQWARSLRWLIEREQART